MLPSAAFVLALLATLFVAPSHQDEWSVIAPAGQGPSPRSSMSADFLAGALSYVVFGGEDEGPLKNDTWIFNFGTSKWQPFKSAVSPSMRSFAPISDFTGRTGVLFGGLYYADGVSQVALGDLWIFNVFSGWAPAVPLPGASPRARFAHATVTVSKGTVVMFGGAAFDANKKLVVFNDMWRINGTAKSLSVQWTAVVPSNTTTNLPLARYGHSLAIVGTKIFLFGGNCRLKLLNDLWIFDTTDRTWAIQAPPTQPAARAFHGMCALGLNLVVQGGETEDSDGFISDSWLYDSFNNVWTLLVDVDAPLSRSKHTMASVTDTACIAFGGFTPDAGATAALSIITQHPTDAQWQIVPADRGFDLSPIPRDLFASGTFDEVIPVVMSNAVDLPSATSQFRAPRLWVMGGRLDDGTILDDIWCYEVDSGVWKQVALTADQIAGGPGAFFGAKAVMYRHLAFVVGGSLSGSSIWFLNRRTLDWTQVTPTVQSNLLQRTLHQVTLYKGLDGDSLIIDGGINSVTKAVLNDVIRIPIARRVAADPNQLMRFLGAQYIRLWDGRRFTPSADRGFAIECVFLVTSLETDGMAILSWAASTGDYMRIFVEYSTGNICVGPHMYDETQHVSCGQKRVDDDRWHHVMVTFGGDDPTAMSLYVDGVYDNRPTEKGASLDYTFEVASVVAGAAFPATVPFLVASQDDGVLAYRRVDTAPFFYGYIDDVRMWDSAQTPASLGYFADNITFPNLAPKDVARSLGSWDFESITTDFETQDGSGNATSPAQLGREGSFASMPLPLESPVPAKIETDASYVVDGPFVMFNTTSTTTTVGNSTLKSSAAPARYSHASTISNLLLYVYGGQNRTNCHDGLWSFNLVTSEWKIVIVDSTDGVVGAAMVAGTIDKVGPVLMILGGTGVAGQSTSSMNTTVEAATYKMVQIGQSTVTVNPLTIGYKMQVDITGHYAGLLPNSSMVILYGGSFVSDQLSEGSTRDDVNVLSNRLFTLNLANPGSLVITQRALGDQPTERIVSPVAVVPDVGAYFFPGKMSEPLWSFSSELSSWDTLPTVPHPTISEPGYAILFDGSAYYFVGHHCDIYDWRTIETDDACGIKNRIYNLNLNSATWSSQEQNITAASEISVNGAPGGVLNLHSDFCAYDGNFHACGERFLDPALAESDTIDDDDITVSSGPDGILMAVWVAGSAIRYSFFDPSTLVWSTSEVATDGENIDNSNPNAAYSPFSKEWIIIYTTTETIRGSGVDTDLVYVRKPHPASVGACSQGSALNFNPNSVTFPAPTISTAFLWIPPAAPVLLAVITFTDGTPALAFVPDPAKSIVLIATSGLGDTTALAAGSAGVTLLFWTEVVKSAVYTGSFYFPGGDSSLSGNSSAVSGTRIISKSFDGAIEDSGAPSPSGRRLLATKKTKSADFTTLETDIVFARVSNGKLLQANQSAQADWADLPVNISSTYVARTNITSGGGTIGMMPGVTASTRCSWSITAPSTSGAMRYEVWIRSLPTEFFTEVTANFAIYDGPEPGYYASLADSYDLGKSASCSQLGVQNSPAANSACLFVTSSDSFSVIIEADHKLVTPFKISYRAVPVTTLNPNARSDLSRETDPFVASRGSTVLLAWSGNGNSAGTSVSDYDIWLSRSTNSGTSWAVTTIDPAASTDSDVQDFKPKMAWSGVSQSSQVVVVVWSSQSSTSSRIKFAVSSDGGASWGTVGVLSTGATNVTYSNPTIAHNGAVWAVVWEATGMFSADSDLVVSRCTQAVPSTSGWSDPVAVFPLLASTDVWSDINPSLAASGSVFLLTWQSNGNLYGMLGTDYDIVGSESADHGKTWSPPIAIIQRAVDPNIAADDARPVSFTATSGGVPYRGVSFVYESVASYEYWSPPSNSSLAMERCSPIDAWSEPRLLDDRYATTDEGSDDFTELDVSDNLMMVAWETTNPFAKRAFPVPNLVSRYLMRDYIELYESETVGAPLSYEVYLEDSEGSSDTTGLFSFDPFKSVFSVQNPVLPVLYPSAKMGGSSPDDLTVRCLRSGLITTYPTQAFAVSVWIKTSHPTTGTLFSWYTMATTEFDTYARIDLSVMDGGNTILFRPTMDEETATRLDLNRELSDNLVADTWHHYVFSFDVTNAQMTVFVDKVIRSASTLGATGQEMPSQGFLFVGGGPVDDAFAPWYDTALAVVAGKAACSANQVFVGSMSDFMVFGADISAEDVTELYNLNSVPYDTNLRYLIAPLSSHLSFQPSGWLDPTKAAVNNGPQLLCVDPANDVFMLGFINQGPAGDMDASVSRYSNGAWTLPVATNTAVGDDEDPFFFDCGERYAMVFPSTAQFRTGTGSDTDIWFTTSPNGIHNWTWPLLLNSYGTTDDYQDTGATAFYADGVATVAWTVPDRKIDTLSDIYISRSLDYCRTWSDSLKVTLEPDGFNVLRSDAILWAGVTNVFLFYVKKPGSATQSDSEIVVTQTTLNPSFFCLVEPEYVDPNAVSTLIPHWTRDATIAAGSDGLWVTAFTQQDPSSMRSGGGGIFVSRTNVSTGEWEQQISVFDNSSVALDMISPALGSNGLGVLVLVWIDSLEVEAKTFSFRLRGSVSSDNGQTWSAPVTIFPFGLAQGEMKAPPAIASDFDNIFRVVWHVSSSYLQTDATGSTSDADIAFVEYDHSNGTWSRPALLNDNALTDLEDDLNPSITYDRTLKSWFTTWETTSSFGGLGSDMDIVYSQRPYVTMDFFCNRGDNFTAVSARDHEDLPGGLSIAAGERFVLLAWNSKHTKPWNGVGTYGSDQDIFVSWSSNYGASFSSVNNAIKRSLTDGTVDDRNPGLIFAGIENRTSVFILGWHTESSPTSPDTYKIFVNRVTNATCSRATAICVNGTTFSFGTEVQVNAAASSSFLAPSFDSLGLASNGSGYVIAAWSDSSSPVNQIAVSSSSDFGKTWSNPARVSSSNVYLQSARIAISNGIIVIASFGMDASATADADLDVYLWRAATNFSTSADFWAYNFSNPNRPGRSDIGIDYAVSIAAQGDTFVLVWITDDSMDDVLGNGLSLGSDLDILFSTSKDRGQTWSAPYPLYPYAFSDMFDDTDPWISVNKDGVFTVVYSTQEDVSSLTGSDSDIMIVESKDGINWSTPKGYNEGFDSDADSEQPANVAAEWTGRFYGAYTCCQAGSADIFVTSWKGLQNASSCARYDEWSYPNSVNPTAKLDGEVVDQQSKVASDGNGGVVVIWSSGTSDVSPASPLDAGLVSWMEFVMTSEEWLGTGSLLPLYTDRTSTDLSWYYTYSSKQATAITMTPTTRFPLNDFALLLQGNAAFFKLFKKGFPNAEFTISSYLLFTVGAAVPTGIQRIWSKTSSAGSFETDFELQYNPTALEVRVRISPTLDPISFPNIALADGNWHHVAVGVSTSGRVASLTIDGISRGRSSGKLVKPVVSTSGYFQIGAAFCDTGCKLDATNATTAACCATGTIFKSLPYYGAMAAFKIFDYYLPLSDIVSIAMYAASPPVYEGSLPADSDIIGSRRQSDGRWGDLTYVNTLVTVGITEDQAPVLGYANGMWTAAWFSTFSDMTVDIRSATRTGTTGSWSPQLTVNKVSRTDLKLERSLSLATNGTAMKAIAVQGLMQSTMRELPLWTGSVDQTIVGFCETAAFSDPTLLISTISANVTLPSGSAKPKITSGSYENFRDLNMMMLPSTTSLFAIYEGYKETVSGASTVSETALFISYFDPVGGDHWYSSLISYDGPSPAISRSDSYALHRAPAAAMTDDGVVAVVWSDLNPDQKDIFLLVGVANATAVTFETRSRLLCPQGVENDVDPVILLAKYNTFMVVWSTLGLEAGSALYATFSDKSDRTLRTWSAPVALFASASAILISPTVGYDEDANFIVVAESSDAKGVNGADTDLVTIRSSDGGSTWSKSSFLNQNALYDTGADTEPAINFAETVLVCVWASDASLRHLTGLDTDIYFSRSTDYGATWSFPFPLNSDAMSDDIYMDSSPDLVCDGPACVVTWSRLNTVTQESDIFLADSPDSGVTWSNARYLNSFFETDTANDDQPYLFVQQGIWAVGFAHGTDVYMSLFSGRTFFRGDYLNLGQNLNAAIEMSSFGRNFIVTAGRDVARESLFDFTDRVVSETAGYKGKLSVSFADDYTEAEMEGLVSVQGTYLSMGFGQPKVSFIERWDYTATIVPFNNPVTASIESMLLVQGGYTPQGVSSMPALYFPRTGEWEEIVCGSGELPRMQGHSSATYNTGSYDLGVIYGNSPLTRATDPYGHLYFLANFNRTVTSSMFGRAEASCTRPIVTGTEPVFNRWQRLVTLRDYLFIIDSAAGASTQEVFMFNFLLNKWSTVPSIKNPPLTSGVFGVFMEDSNLFVLSANAEGVSLKNADLDRINAAKCSATAPFGDYLANSAAGERGVIDVTAKTSLDAFVSNGADLDLGLVNSLTGARVKGKYLGSPALGIFRFVYSASIPGNYELRITAAGEHISGSPFSVEVQAGKTSLSKTTIDQSSFADGVEANVFESFTIYSKDAFGNDVDGGDDVKVYITQKNTVNVAQIADNADGTYDVSFMVTKAGDYTVSALLNSVHISGSPFGFFVDAGSASGGESKTEGADVGQVPAGQGGIVTVRAADGAGNLLTKGLGADAVDISFFLDDGSRRALVPVPKEDVPTTVIDKGDGSYKISYFPFVEGKFTFAIKIKNVSVPGSPFGLTIVPVFDPPDPNKFFKVMWIIVAVTAFLGAFCHPGVFERISMKGFYKVAVEEPAEAEEAPDPKLSDTSVPLGPSPSGISRVSPLGPSPSGISRGGYLGSSPSGLPRASPNYGNIQPFYPTDEPIDEIEIEHPETSSHKSSSTDNPVGTDIDLPGTAQHARIQPAGVF